MAITVEYEAGYGIGKLMEKARSFARSNGAKVEGDDRSGKVSNGGLFPFKGTYHVSGEHVRIAVTQKPLLVGWDFVRAEILKWLKAHDAP